MMKEEGSQRLHAGDLPLEGKKELMKDESSADLESNDEGSFDRNSLPIDGGGNNDVIAFDSKKTKKLKCIRMIAVLLISVITIATAVTLGVFLTKEKEDKKSSAQSSRPAKSNADIDEGFFAPDEDFSSPMVPSTPSPTITSSPTNPPILPSIQEQFDKVKEYTMKIGLSTSENFERDDSAQTRAALFMAEDTDVYPVPTSTSYYNDTIIWQERYATVVLYYSTGGDEWQYKYNFLTKGRSICEWGITFATQVGIVRNGVGCSRQQRVLEITLDDNNLKGTLPDELAYLSEMGFFSISLNEITGTLPKRLSYWKGMTIFDARHNLLEGELPSWLDKWTGLNAIGLSHNKFEGRIPSSFRSLKNLTFLYLEDNLLEGSLDNLEENKLLRALYLENNFFAQKIDSSFLADHTSLVRLDISENEFSGEVPVHLFAGNTLDILDAHGNQISSFPDRISGQNNTLGFLALQFNPLAGSFPTNTISNAKQLRHLDLTSTSMTGTMPKELGDLTNLVYFFMAGTEFNPGPIPEEYQKLTTLDDLSLKKSGRTGNIPSWMGDLDRLMLLDLDSNNLSGTIPSELGNLKRLGFLFLNRNQLRGSVPAELGGIRQLDHLLLDNNDLTAGVQGLCDALPNTRLTSDCGAMSGEVICECCAVCCDDDEEFAECTEHAENDFLALLKPQWEDNYDRKERINFFQTRYYFNLADYNITR